jgi:cytochrome P450
MRAVADEIFVRAVLGVEHDARASGLARAIGSLLWTPGNPPLTIPGPDQGLLGRAVDALYRRRRASVAALLAEEIRLRRAGDPGDGALGLLVRSEPNLDEQAIVEELLSTLMAAQEPMAAALTWLALCTAATPGAGERIAEEGLEGAYGRALVSESLRLHPSAVGVLRRLREDATVAGAQLPAGTTAMLPIPLLQRDRRHVPEPDRFIPERYLPDGGAGAGSAGIPWLAFGGGERGCVGRHLAIAELAAVIPAMWRRLRVRAPEKAERMALRATILVPSRSGLVVADATPSRPRTALRGVPAAVDA